MARSMNQTLAWISSGVLSLALFGAGITVFKLMVKGGSHAAVGDDHKAADNHGDSLSAKSGHGSDPAGKVEHEADSADHKTKMDPKSPSKAETTPKKAEPDIHEPATPSDHKDTHNSAGSEKASGEEEISADQFKEKSEHH